MALTDATIAEYQKPLTGHSLPASTLPELVASESIVILHFLRHLGCLYCRQSVSDLYAFVQQQRRFPPIYFVHQSPVEQANDFFAKHYPGARHISDPKLALYNLFAINRLNPVQFMNPLQIMKGVQAFIKGHRQEAPQGNEWVLSGTFLFHNGKLRWQHRATYAGDDPDWRLLAT